MKKLYIIFGVALLAGIGIYYTGLYTYFTPTEVNEELPAHSTAATEPVQTLASGKFVEIDFIHKGRGEARLIRADGKTILRFENFNVTSGPDLYVYLSKSSSPSGDIESLDEYLDLGLLKGTAGNQNYEIAEDATGYKSAIIWCKRFGVLFSYAVME